jgi:hypothetical protein
VTGCSNKPCPVHAPVTWQGGMDVNTHYAIRLSAALISVLKSVPLVLAAHQCLQLPVPSRELALQMAHPRLICNPANIMSHCCYMTGIGDHHWFTGACVCDVMKCKCMSPLAHQGLQLHVPSHQLALHLQQPLKICAQQLNWRRYMPLLPMAFLTSACSPHRLSDKRQQQLNAIMLT